MASSFAVGGEGKHASSFAVGVPQSGKRSTEGVQPPAASLRRLSSADFTLSDTLRAGKPTECSVDWRFLGESARTDRPPTLPAS